MENRYTPTMNELSIIRVFATTCEQANARYHYDIKDFIIKTLKTDIFDDFLSDYTVYSQSPLYVIECLEEELDKKNIHYCHESEEEAIYPHYNKECAYWIGYILMYWKAMEHVDGYYLLQYDIDAMIDGYDSLHSQDVQYAITVIKEEYRID